MRNVIKPVFTALTLIFMVSLFSETATAGLPKSKGPVRILSKVAIQDFYLFTPNRISTWTTNVGEIVSFRKTGSSGMEWPAGSAKTINFTSGLWVGGLVGTQIRTAAAEYVVEFVPGKFVDWRNQDDTKYKVYTITRDDFLEEPGEEGEDYQNWPFEDGAPMKLNDNGMPVDIDGNEIASTDYDNMVPGLTGDMLSWSVFNDADITAHVPLFTTSPLGLEVQQTLFAFDRGDAFGDMMFMKYLVINAGTDTITDTYLSFWADVDLGDASDDLVGGDTVLSLGYNYNDGADGVYGPQAPALGYDFFQGPIVASPGDTAKVSRHFRSSGIVPGFKNLPMTSLSAYINGGDECERDPETAKEMYSYQQGFDKCGKVKFDPETGLPSKFHFTGDPVTGEGWIHTLPADMRFMLTTGPFTLAPGDSQEMVGGHIIAQGENAKDSVKKLKINDIAAQKAYDKDFALPAAPPAPKVTVGSIDNKVVLTWEPNAESYHVEDVVPNPVTDELTFYDFQGYNIYQVNGPIASPDQKFELLATYDVKDDIGDIEDLVTIGKNEVLVVVQEASNTGIQRFLTVTEDKFTGLPLVNFRKYYFMVEAYGHNEFGLPKILASGNITTAIPGPPLAGTVLSYDEGEKLSTSDSSNFERVGTSPNSGISDIGFDLTVIDPNETKDKTYEISFFTAMDTTIDTLETPPDTTIEITDYMWKMTDLSTGSTVIDSQGILRTDPTVDEAELRINPFQKNIVDGLSPSLSGTYRAPIDTLSDGTTRQTVNVDPAKTILNFVGSSREFVESISSSLLKDFQSIIPVGGDNPLTFRRDVEMRFTDTGSRAWRYSSPLKDMLLNTENPTAYEAPYEMWDTEYDNGDGTFGRQINSILIDDWEKDDSTNGFLGSFNGLGDIVIPVYTSYALDTVTAADTMAAWMLYFAQADSIEQVSASLDTTFVAAGYSTGDVFRFTFENHIVPEEDTLSFTTLAPVTGDDANLKSEILKINVFPNPYFGQNIEETNQFNRFVTFTHLPAEGVKIRIFTLAGHLVKVIDHNNLTSMERWDLTNNRNIPVASGMYIAYIETDSGSSKILKLAVFIPEERLDLF